MSKTTTEKGQTMNTQQKCESIVRSYINLRTVQGMEHDEAINDIRKNLGLSRDAIRVAFMRTFRDAA